MHGSNFIANITPVIAMLRSGLGRRPYLKALEQIRDRLLADDEIRTIWNNYEISSPFLATSCTIKSPIGTFRYETANLPISGALHSIVVQVPDTASRELLRNNMTPS